MRKNQQHVCPHCLNALSLREVPFRCQALPQVCRPQSDEIYARFFTREKEILLGALTYPKPQSLARTLQNLHPISSTKCHLCATPTESQVCNHCHGPLPQGFLEAAHYPIAFISDDPKTTAHYIRALKKTLSMISAHDISATMHEPENLEGVILKFDQGRKGFKSGKQIMTSFYVFTPKDLENEMTQMALRRMKGCLFLTPGDALFSNRADDGAGFQKSFERVTNLYPAELNCPLGVVFTHLEGWGGILPHASILLQSPNHTDGYDAPDGRHVSQELMAYLGARFGVNFLRLLQQQIKTLRLFTASTQGMPNATLKEYARVVDPYFWLLHQWNLIP